MKKLLIVFLLLILPVTAQAMDVTLGWSANTEPNLAGYVVYHGIEAGKYISKEDAGNVTEYTITSLDPNRTHFFVVTAKSDNGFESLPSNEVNTLKSPNLGFKEVVRIIIEVPQ